MTITDMSDKKSRSPIADQLQNASELAAQGEYVAALQQVKLIKSSQPQNIYVLAFERQLEQLVELTDTGVITEEQRTDILESIPGIVERAIEQPNTRPSDMASPERRTAAAQASTEERSAALSWLKNQYFQHAHDYVQKGQFSHALTEIQRVFIIDPNNDTARDFEQQIRKLLDLKAQGAGALAASPIEEEPSRKDSNFWLIAAGVIFVVVALLVIYFLNR